MLSVSELTGARWPPCADVRLRWPATRTRHLVFIYIYAYHYQHNVMGERAAWGKMAAMCGRLTPLAGNADETSSLYIYIYAHTAQTFSNYLLIFSLCVKLF